MLEYDSNAERMMNKLTQYLSHDTICFPQISCAANLIPVIPVSLLLRVLIQFQQEHCRGCQNQMVENNRVNEYLKRKIY